MCHERILDTKECWYYANCVDRSNNLLEIDHDEDTRPNCRE